ncbi:MAG: AraC family transcriptional regulator [bacterium]|nr:AraC family transcriptional regulator [bacterium]
MVNVYSEQIQVVEQYIRDHLSEPLSREVLAEIAGFSIPHFHRVFQGCTGESAAAYVRRIRMERAGRKLRMGAVDITEVAIAAGYDSQAAFTKAFRKHFSLTPGEFRSLSCSEATALLRKGQAP